MKNDRTRKTASRQRSGLTYAASGVDVTAAERFVAGIDGIVRRTHTAGVIKRPGAFAALWALDAARMRAPVLVSSTDGVGTKLLIAQAVGRHDGVGTDCVAMNVNDILCCGARPLFFLDYIACGRLNESVLNQIVRGMAHGCRAAGCALIGGETAEMPGCYEPHEYDLAGFAVGMVERHRLIDGRRIREGDVLIGLASNGLHANGFSLVRRLFSKREWVRHAEEWLRPTAIYVRPVLDCLKRVAVKGMAHNTGGAFQTKVTKILPPGLGMRFDVGSWPVPNVFHKIQKKGKISDSEMYRTFNMGIGFVLVVDRKDERKTLDWFKKTPHAAYRIGEVVRSKQRCLLPFEANDGRRV